VDEVSDIDRVERMIGWQLVKLLKSGVVIMDCASAAKPATITFYKLAKK